MNEKFSKIINHPMRVPISLGLSFGAGFGIGYILGRRNRLKYVIPAITTRPLHPINAEDYIELDKVRVDNVDEVSEVGRQFAETKLFETIVVERNQVEETEVADDLPIRQSVFSDLNDVWDQEKEDQKRTTEAPYVLQREEFYEEQQGYHQSTLTYYAGDEILVDEEDKPIYNYIQIIGPILFGHGSGDPKVFYVRNDKLRAEYEIIHDQGLYSVEVLGLEIEENARANDLKHSTHRKFREE